MQTMAIKPIRISKNIWSPSHFHYAPHSPNRQGSRDPLRSSDAKRTAQITPNRPGFGGAPQTRPQVGDPIATELGPRRRLAASRGQADPPPQENVRPVGQPTIRAPVRIEPGGPAGQ